MPDMTKISRILSITIVFIIGGAVVYGNIHKSIEFRVNTCSSGSDMFVCDNMSYFMLCGPSYK